jgi:spore coat polysaccharide biosynthesis protein SpsF (cytidylyltransferase family)
MIEWQISRIRESNTGKIILATSNDRSDDELVKTVRDLGIGVHRGSLSDVHSRFLNIIQDNMPDYFIRLTGDCPVVMPDLLNSMISEFELNKLDYLSNTNPPSYPDGLDVEVISSYSFLEFSKLHLTSEEKEHVTLGIRHRADQFKMGNFMNNRDLSRMRWTVDYEEDFKFISRVFEYFLGREKEFTIDDILRAVDAGEISENVISHEFRNISLKNGVDGV